MALFAILLSGSVWACAAHVGPSASHDGPSDVVGGGSKVVANVGPRPAGTQAIEPVVEPGFSAPQYRTTVAYSLTFPNPSAADLVRVIGPLRLIQNRAGQWYEIRHDGGSTAVPQAVNDVPGRGLPAKDAPGRVPDLSGYEFVDSAKTGLSSYQEVGIWRSSKNGSTVVMAFSPGPGQQGPAVRQIASLGVRARTLSAFPDPHGISTQIVIVSEPSAGTAQVMVTEASWTPEI